MKDSFFWRCVSVLAVGGLFYVGHGLHESGRLESPQFATPAIAGGVIQGESTNMIYTQSEDGTTVYSWVLGVGGIQDPLTKPTFASKSKAN